mmetsp:Transcript_1607/g.3416  ORF Transcript_1607/g.3416 Transcript_1607/m.3416 type:complete len:336 (+) Transcript_1607:2081-3088(+)
MGETGGSGADATKGKAVDGSGEMESGEETLIESTDDPRAWVFSEQEILCTPAAQHGVQKNVERWIMAQFVGHIEQLGAELNVPQLAMAVAIKLLQRYLMVESVTRVFAASALPAAALFLACKMQECPRRLRQVVIVSYRIRIAGEPGTLKQLDAYTATATAAADAQALAGASSTSQVPSDAFAMPNALFRRERDAVLHHEQAILRAVAFDLHVEHPYRYIMELIDAYTDCKGDNDKRMVTQISWNFLNDSFRTLSHMRFNEKEIASAALLLAARFCGVALKKHEVPLSSADVQSSTTAAKPVFEAWWQHFGQDPERIMNAAHMMLDSYDTKAINP